ncbi:MAG TPA: hypothetical protein VFH43_07235, partial [Candidatus Kapabacteria bacterium]|nr:hypothetical protein [Candidatus Kapabacteria bacterium]
MHLFNKTSILWLIPVALLVMGCAIWNVPFTIFWEIALLAWFTLAPGYALVRWISTSELTSSQRFALSFAIGMGLTVLVRVFVHQLDALDQAAATISGLTAIALIWGYLIKRPKPVSDDRGAEWRALAILASICASLVLIYNFLGLHYAGEGALEMRGLFAIDVPYLIGNMPSLDIYGRMHDMHQNGLWFPYHDHVYRAISVAHQVGGDYFSLIAYSFPFFGSLCASISLFGLFRLRLDVRNALLTTIAVLLLASSWGDHILTGALSPSYLAGIVYACAVILLTCMMHRAVGKGRRLALWILLGLSLAALAKTKLPLFAIGGGAIGVVALRYPLQYTRASILVLAACLLSLIFAAMTSGYSSYHPSN